MSRLKIVTRKALRRRQRHPIYCLHITVPISAIYYPIMSYYLHLLRIYIEAFQLHLQSSRLCNSSTLQSLHLRPVWSTVWRAAQTAPRGRFLIYFNHLQIPNIIKEPHVNNLSRLARSSGARYYKQLIYNLRTSTGGGVRRN